jgi:hypothetical protein
MLTASNVSSQDFQSITRFFDYSKNINGDIMVPYTDLKSQDLIVEMQKSIMKNKQWFEEYLKKYSDVKPLPYNEKLGITESEYKYLQESSTNIKFVKKESIEFYVESVGEYYTIYFAGKYAQLNPIKIKKSLELVTTPYGNYPYDSIIENKDESVPIGIWVGRRWLLNTIENVSNPKGIYSTFSIGVKEDSIGVIDYTVKNFIPGKEHNFSLTIFFKIIK